MKKPRGLAWTRSLRRGVTSLGRQALQAGSAALLQALAPPARAARRPATRRPAAKRAAPRPPAAARRSAAAKGNWLPGLAMGPGGARRWRLYSPPGMRAGEHLPLLVLLHGCTQDAAAFAASTRMNRLAAQQRFLVLYPEQDRMANAQGCWNWFDTDRGRAQAEADLVLHAIDQVCRSHGADRHRVVVAGLSAGASLAALLAARHPHRISGVVMHSGIPPGTAHSTLTALRAMQGRGTTAPMAAMPATGWPALLVLHGSADTVVSPANAEAAVLAWAAAAGALPAATRQVQRGHRLAMQVTDFQRRGRTVATLALVQGLAHAWSGGAAGQPFSDPAGPDASRLVWAFARKQFASRAASAAALAAAA
jgi:poly(hydroxyalkanoate) depolymerase family esterase